MKNLEDIIGLNIKSLSLPALLISIGILIGSAFALCFLACFLIMALL